MPSTSVGRSPGGRPRVGISRCLLGDEARYDDGHTRGPLLIDTLGLYVEWVPVCPEVEIGMGTPREPIQLVASRTGVASGAARVRLVGVASARDWTDAMVDADRLRDAAVRASFLDRVHAHQHALCEQIDR